MRNSLKTYFSLGMIAISWMSILGIIFIISIFPETTDIGLGLISFVGIMCGSFLSQSLLDHINSDNS